MLSLLLAVPSCIYSFWYGVIPTSYFIFILIFLSRLSLDCSGEMPYVVRAPNISAEGLHFSLLKKVGKNNNVIIIGNWSHTYKDLCITINTQIANSNTDL